MSTCHKKLKNQENFIIIVNDCMVIILLWITYGENGEKIHFEIENERDKMQVAI